jgi:homoserine dehydrogenase
LIDILIMKPIQVGLLGIGTVGSGVFSVLARNQEEIQRRAGRGIAITMVADLDVERAKSAVGEGVQVVSDARAVIANPDIDIVIELIGGYGVAKQLVMEAIAAGKHVVTANKALLAVHGSEIFAAASAKGVMVAFEAAVAGAFPSSKRCARASRPTASSGWPASSTARPTSSSPRCATRAWTSTPP